MEEMDPDEMTDFLETQYLIEEELKQLQRMIGSMDETGRQPLCIRSARILARRHRDFHRACQLIDNLRRKKAVLSEELCREDVIDPEAFLRGGSDNPAGPKAIR